MSHKLHLLHSNEKRWTDSNYKGKKSEIRRPVGARQLLHLFSPLLSMHYSVDIYSTKLQPIINLSYIPTTIQSPTISTPIYSSPSTPTPSPDRTDSSGDPYLSHTTGTPYHTAVLYLPDSRPTSISTEKVLSSDRRRYFSTNYEYKMHPPGQKPAQRY
jgi:hypothetical protein